MPAEGERTSQRETLAGGHLEIDCHGRSKTSGGLPGSFGVRASDARSSIPSRVDALLQRLAELYRQEGRPEDAARVLDASP